MSGLLDITVQSILNHFLSGIGSFFTGVVITSSFGIRRYLRFRRLRAAFGRKIGQNKDIALSLPHWTTIPKSRQETRFVRKDYGGIAHEYYGPDNVFAEKDVRAAASISSIFGDYFRKQLRLIADSDEANWEETTVITIGSPIANFHCERFYKQLASRKEYDAIPRFCCIEEDDTSKSKLKIVLDAASLTPVPGHTLANELFSSDTVDYGIVLRLTNIHAPRGDHYVFVAAGIHAASTREAGLILKKNSHRFCGPGDVKLLVFQMQRRRAHTGQIIATFGL